MKVSFNTQVNLSNEVMIQIVAYMQGLAEGNITKGQFETFVKESLKEAGLSWLDEMNKVVLNHQETMIAWAVATKFTKDGIPVPLVPAIEA